MEKSLATIHLDLEDAAHLAQCEPIEFLRRYAPKLQAITVDSSEYLDGEPHWLYGDVMELLDKEGT